MISREIATTFDYDELFDKEVLNNMKMIKDLASDLDHEYFDNNIFRTDVVKSPLFSYAVLYEFIARFFDNKYNLQYHDFIHLALKESECMVDDADGYVYGNLCRRRVYSVMVPFIETFIDATTYPHEFSHYLNMKIAPKMHNDLLLIEVPSIFMQHLFLDYCITNDYFKECNNLVSNYHYDMAERFLVNIDTTFNCFKKDPYEIVDSIEDIDTFTSDIQYYFGYIYANMMYNYYLEDEKNFKKRFINLYQGGKLEELLRYYNIDLKDEKTVDTTYDIVKKLIK